MKEQKRHDEKNGKEHRALGLTLIAIGKMIKVTLLVVAGVAALWFAHRHGQLEPAAAFTSASPGSHELHRLIAHVAGISTKHLELLGVGSFVYAAVFATEGIGLWLQKKWAEYLTVGVTLSFVPIEIYEIVQHMSPIKIATLVLNLAALVYLVVRLMGERGHAQLGSASR